ncbi:MAG: hypothetical protein U9O98_10485 [Asgard group archaeon]|nr:hypothetical protein [Asgard group archaeon]
MIYEVGTWEVPIAKSKEHEEIIQSSIEFQRNNKEEFSYQRSQFFKSFSEDSQTEKWMFIDEYQDKKTYDQWTKESQLVEIQMAKILKEWEKFIIKESLQIKVFESPKKYII